MTPTHTMRLPVRAWQVGADGSPPEETIPILARRQGRATFSRGWSWIEPTAPGYNAYPTVGPGDWIVESAYGLEAMTDAEFRARCEEVPDA